jgi:hypothetical protein
MPLKSGKGSFKSNVRTLMGEVGKSPHVQSRKQALAIAYAKERGRAEGGAVTRRSARLKQAPERELPIGNRAAPIDPRYEQMPTSENIEDRRGEWGRSLGEQLVAPTGFNLSEWGTMLRRPLTPIEESLPHRNWPENRATGGLVNHDDDPDLPPLQDDAQLENVMPGLQQTPPAYRDTIEQMQRFNADPNFFLRQDRENVRIPSLRRGRRHRRGSPPPPDGTIEELWDVARPRRLQDGGGDGGGCDGGGCGSCEGACGGSWGDAGAADLSGMNADAFGAFDVGQSLAFDAAMGGEPGVTSGPGEWGGWGAWASFDANTGTWGVNDITGNLASFNVQDPNNINPMLGAQWDAPFAQAAVGGTGGGSWGSFGGYSAGLGGTGQGAGYFGSPGGGAFGSYGGGYYGSPSYGGTIGGGFTDGGRGGGILGGGTLGGGGRGSAGIYGPSGGIGTYGAYASSGGRGGGRGDFGYVGASREAAANIPTTAGQQTAAGGRGGLQAGTGMLDTAGSHAGATGGRGGGPAAYSEGPEGEAPEGEGPEGETLSGMDIAADAPSASTGVGDVAAPSGGGGGGGGGGRGGGAEAPSGGGGGGGGGGRGGGVPSTVADVPDYVGAPYADMGQPGSLDTPDYSGAPYADPASLVDTPSYADAPYADMAPSTWGGPGAQPTGWLSTVLDFIAPQDPGTAGLAPYENLTGTNLSLNVPAFSTFFSPSTWSMSPAWESGWQNAPSVFAPSTWSKDPTAQSFISPALQAAQTAWGWLTSTPPGELGEAPGTMSGFAPGVITSPVDIPQTSPAALEAAYTTLDDMAAAGALTSLNDFISEVSPSTLNDYIMEASPSTLADYIMEASPSTMNDYVMEASPSTLNDYIMETAPGVSTPYADILDTGSISYPTSPDTAYTPGAQPQDAPGYYESTADAAYTAAQNSNAPTGAADAAAAATAAAAARGAGPGEQGDAAAAAARDAGATPQQAAEVAAAVEAVATAAAAARGEPSAPSRGEPSGRGYTIPALDPTTAYMWGYYSGDRAALAPTIDILPTQMNAPPSEPVAPPGEPTAPLGEQTPAPPSAPPTAPPVQEAQPGVTNIPPTTPQVPGEPIPGVTDIPPQTSPDPGPPVQPDIPPAAQPDIPPTVPPTIPVVPPALPRARPKEEEEEESRGDRKDSGLTNRGKLREGLSAPVPADAPGVVQNQGSATRSWAITPELKGPLEQAAAAAGVQVHVFSGGQTEARTTKKGTNWTGTHRHDITDKHRGAADVQLIDRATGRLLDWRNENDLKQMMDFVREAARLGLDGQGAGTSPSYMGTTSIHVGFSSGGKFGHATFWKANDRGSRMLQQAYREGMRQRGQEPAREAIRTRSQQREAQRQQRQQTYNRLLGRPPIPQARPAEPAQPAPAPPIEPPPQVAQPAPAPPVERPPQTVPPTAPPVQETPEEITAIPPTAPPTQPTPPPVTPPPVPPQTVPPTAKPVQPDVGKAFTPLLNKIPADKRGDMQKTFDKMSVKEKTDLLNKGPQELINQIAKQVGRDPSQIRSWFDNSYSLIGHPGYPGGMAALTKDWAAAKAAHDKAMSAYDKAKAEYDKAVTAPPSEKRSEVPTQQVGPFAAAAKPAAPAETRAANIGGVPVTQSHVTPNREVSNPDIYDPVNMPITPTSMVIHYTGGGTIGSIRDSLAAQNNGYNYFVGRDGKITELVPWDQKSNHVGDEKGPQGSTNLFGVYNQNSIGIAYDAKSEKDITAAQLEAGKQLVQGLSQVSGIPLSAVRGHGEVSPGRKAANEGSTTAGWARSQGQRSEAPGFFERAASFVSQFSPISTAEAKGRGPSGPSRDEQIAIALAREGGQMGGQPGRSVVGNKIFTFYAPGASGPKGTEGPMIGSKGNALTTLDDVRNGAGHVSLAGDRGQFGQMVFIGNITYKSPIDGITYTLNDVWGRVDDTGSEFRGSKNPDKNQFDIAVGDFSTGWNDTTAGAFVGRNVVTASPGRGIGADIVSAPGLAPPAETEAPAVAGTPRARGGLVHLADGGEARLPDGTPLPRPRPLWSQQPGWPRSQGELREHIEKMSPEERKFLDALEKGTAFSTSPQVEDQERYRELLTAPPQDERQMWTEREVPRARWRNWPQEVLPPEEMPRTGLPPPQFHGSNWNRYFQRHPQAHPERLPRPPQEAVYALGGLVDMPGYYEEGGEAEPFAAGGLATPQMNTLFKQAHFGGLNLKSAIPRASRMSSTPGVHLINSSVPGRTDRIPQRARTGSYVLPADVVSGLGQGNTKAGAKLWGETIAGAIGPAGIKTAIKTRAMKAPSLRMPSPRVSSSRSTGLKLQEGGEVEDEFTPIITAGGELIIDPEIVEALGGGDADAGKRMLADSVKKVRRQTITHLQSLPGPVK